MKVSHVYDRSAISTADSCFWTHFRTLECVVPSRFLFEHFYLKEDSYCKSDVQVGKKVKQMVSTGRYLTNIKASVQV